MPDNAAKLPKYHAITSSVLVLYLEMSELEISLTDNVYYDIPLSTLRRNQALALCDRLIAGATRLKERVNAQASDQAP
jgi:hypothetical protein